MWFLPRRQNLQRVPDQEGMSVSMWNGVVFVCDSSTQLLHKHHALSRVISFQLLLTPFVSTSLHIVSDVFWKLDAFGLRFLIFSRLSFPNDRRRRWYTSRFGAVIHSTHVRFEPYWRVWNKTETFSEDSWQWSWRGPQNNLDWFCTVTSRLSLCGSHCWI